MQQSSSSSDDVVDNSALVSFSTSDLFEFLKYSALPAAPTATLCKCKRGHMQSLCKSTVWQKSHETGNPNPALSILPRNLMPNIFPLATDVFFKKWQQWLEPFINVLCGDIWSDLHFMNNSLESPVLDSRSSKCRSLDF